MINGSVRLTVTPIWVSVWVCTDSGHPASWYGNTACIVSMYVPSLTRTCSSEQHTLAISRLAPRSPSPLSSVMETGFRERDSSFFLSHFTSGSLSSIFVAVFLCRHPLFSLRSTPVFVTHSLTSASSAHTSSSCYIMSLRSKGGG